MLYELFILWFVLLFIMQIVYLFKSIKTKYNKNWIILFISCISSIFSAILLCIYSLFNAPYLGWNVLLNFFLGGGAVISYVIVLLISTISKLVERIKDKKLNISREKLEKNVIKKTICGTFLTIFLVSTCIYAVDYSICIIQEKIDLKKEEEQKISKEKEMVEYINNKYELSLSINDIIYYRKEDYSADIGLLATRKNNIPNIAIFKNNTQKITVIDRKGFFSDDGQLKQINYYIADYFSKIVGTDIEFVQVRKTYNGNIEDGTINEVLQYGFNEKITSYNINRFIDYLLSEEDLELIFYIKDSENRTDLINLLTDKLNYLKEYKNIERVMFYIYDKNETLIVNNIENDLIALDGKKERDFKFDYYYVPNKYEYYYPETSSTAYKFKDEKFNTFLVSAYLTLNRGYGAGQGNRQYSVKNGWYVFVY